MQETIAKLDKPRWRVVERKAKELSSAYSAPPIPVLEIAENQGVDVEFADFGETGEKVAGFCDFESAKLYVNANDRLTRQTFTIAHELGHWLLHKSYFDQHPAEYRILPRFQSSEENNAFEKEANFFAANLLVPDSLLQPVKHAGASELASIFAVSRTMMENRLKNV